MAFIKVANVSEIQEGSGKIVDGNGVEIALFRKNGKYYAINNTCPHQGGPLGEGFLEDCTVSCPWHGWKFDISSGQSLMPPGMRIKVYKVEQRGNDVYIDVEE